MKKLLQTKIQFLWLLPSLLLIEFFSLKKIFLITADLGRHLTNGRLVWENSDLLRLNFYSYSFPDFPFVNHHWGSGVVFYGIFSLFNFKGLSHFHALMMVLAALPVLIISQKISGTKITLLLSLLTLPLVTARTEVRPETFSYLFTAAFYMIIWLWREGKISHKILYVLPLIMVFWVNLHIYFFLGFVLLGIYLFDVWREEKTSKNLKVLAIVTVLCALATLCNPLGWNVTFYPLKIFDDYSYMIAENQSITFFWQYPIPILGFITFHSVALLLIFGVIIQAFQRKKFPNPTTLFGIICLIMAALAIRNFSLLGLFSIPALAQVTPKISSLSLRKNWMWLIFGGILFSFGHTFQFAPFIGGQFGSGLHQGVDKAAQFYKDQKLKGPIFNNYDIGGYLIYNLFPSERVFVDNRPEAYPGDFFRNVYLPMQEDQKVWQSALDRYGFNVIFFFRHDNTASGQAFLLSRIQDPDWVPVYVDGFTLIFVRANESNREVIQNFALPKDRFKLGSN